MRLWLYLTLIVNTVILLAFLALGAYSAREQSLDHLRNLQHDSRNIARSLAASAADDLLLLNLDKLEDQLLRHAAISTLDDLLVADAGGDVLVRVKRIPEGGFKVVYTRQPATVPLDAREQLDEQAFSTTTRVERGQLLGWVRVTTGLGTMHELRRKIWRDAACSSLLAALFAGLTLALALRHASRDLAKAAAFASDLKQQHGGTLAADSPILELRQLQRALDLAYAELAAQFRQLQDAEERKRAIFEAVLDCIITFDTTGAIVDFNPAAERALGIARDHALGRHLSDFIAPPAQPCPLPFAPGQAGAATTALLRIESMARHSDGSRFPVELSVVPFEKGEQTLLLGAIRDISVRKNMEADREHITTLLRQTVADLQVRQRALDEHAIVGITDLQGTINYANQKFADVSRYPLAELIGNNMRVLESNDQDASVLRAMWNTLASGGVWHGELANRRKDGGLYWVAYTIVSIHDEADQLTGYIAIGTDITARKLAEQALADARRRELETGHEIQRSLLLGDIPTELQGAELATYTLPTQGVDGDFYAFTRFRPDCFELLLGDVMGKGVPAALTGAGIKSNYHKVLAELLAESTAAGALPEPAAVMNAMHQCLTPRLIGLQTFATLALYRFDLAAGTLTLVSAGHPPALLEQAGTIQTVEGDNLPLGVIEAEVYVQRGVPVGPGDRLLAYSDGLSEAHSASGEEFGADRLRQAFALGAMSRLPPAQMIQSIRHQVRAFSGSDTASDDQTALIIALTPAAHPHAATSRVLHLPWNLAALEPLRLAIPETATRLDEQERQAILLATFEAATNILRHVTPCFADAMLTCRMTQEDNRFLVELLYPGPAFTPPRDATPDFSGNSEGGFGLYIIQQCADSIEYTTPAPAIANVRLCKRAALSH